MNKQKFLKSLGADSGRAAKELNQLIFDWYEDTDIKVVNTIPDEDVDNITTAAKYWLYLLDNESEGFRDRRHNTTFHKLLKRVIENDEPINYFGILCPSYKKGIGSVGFAKQPGNTTYRAFHNVLRMAEVTRSFGIQATVRMFFADISVESVDKFTDQDINDLRTIAIMDGIIGKALGVPYQTLTEFAPELEEEVGLKGKELDPSTLPVDPKAVERAMWRDRQFYPRMFGWSIEEAEKRTICHAHSYYWQGEVIRQRLPNAVMVYSAYDYEKGGLYNGKDGLAEPSIIYPHKPEDNPPCATLKMV